MDNSFNFKAVVNVMLVPFIILVSIYIVGLVIYCITCKNKKDPKYIYNINFNLYVIGIMIGTFCISLSSIYFIYKLKVHNIFDYKSLCYALLFLLGLIVMFVMFVKTARKGEKDEIKEYQKNKELKLMVNEIKTTKIEKKKKNKKTENKEETIEEIKTKPEVQVIEIIDDLQVEEIKEKPKKNKNNKNNKNSNKTKVKENDETIEIEIL